MVNFTHPANRNLLVYMAGRETVDRPRELNPADADDPYYKLGTHPEIVERLWDELGGSLPKPCRWILYGSPVLVHPRTGVVFGFAGGSQTYALRLPEAERAAAIGAGAKTVHQYPAYPELNVPASKFDLADFGPEWVFGAWLTGEDQWCRAAFDFASS
jgi:hypothetical protein